MRWYVCKGTSAQTNVDKSKTNRKTPQSEEKWNPSRLAQQQQPLFQPRQGGFKPQNQQQQQPNQPKPRGKKWVGFEQEAESKMNVEEIRVLHTNNNTKACA
jgi:hypothetical protein